MSNKYFRFKQFIVYQEKAAMKVGVDSVLLGAWAEFDNAKRILDIGTGTGLLSLMAAQKSEAQITAIEIDSDSIKQAKANVNLSTWSKRIDLINVRFQDFSMQTKLKFDFAICNPPYFNGTYQSPNQQRNKARHNNTLPLPDLFAGLNRILAPNGKLYIIYPYFQKDDLISEAYKHNFYPNKILEIKPHKNKPAKRIAICFSQKKMPSNITQLFIKDLTTMQYSREYKSLTKGFYLDF